jgi:tetratricopeptide (TPR) repeat protein
MSDLIALDARALRNYKRSFENALDEGANGPSLQMALGMCLLKLGLYGKALDHFEAAVIDDVENSEAYFYAAVASLAGKKPFLAPLAVVRSAEEYLNAALRLEDRGIYFYLLGYLRFDYYERKSLNVTPPYAYFLEKSLRQGVTDLDIRNLFELLEVDIDSVSIPTSVSR